MPSHESKGHIAVAPPSMPLLKLDIGSGPNVREGFEGVDQYSFDGKVKHVVDLRKPWPWADNSVEEAHCSHCIEHFEAMERCHIVNELYRVLVPGGKCTLIAPHWASCRAYGDPTHHWPPISEFWFYYLSKEWRMGNTEKELGANAPHTDASVLTGGFACDFDAQWGYGMHPALTTRNSEFQQDAFQWKKEAIQDIIATLTAKK